MNVSWMVRRVVLAGFLGVATVSVGNAGTCGQDHCWGAVAVGPDGMAARASGLRTAQEAMARIDRVCRGACESREIFVDGCAVLAEDRDRTVWGGFGLTRKKAEAEAMTLCGGDIGSICRVRVWACSK